MGVRKGMRGTKLWNKQQQKMREPRLEMVAKLFFAGVPQYEIAKQCGVSSTTITKDLQLLDERWKKSQLVNLDSARARELERVNWIERVVTEQWERSLTVRPRVVKVERALREPKVDEGEFKKQSKKVPKDLKPILTIIKQMVEVKSGGGLGDTRFLQIKQWCVEQRCRILGLTAPPQMNQTNNTVINSGPRWDELFSAPPPPDPVAEKLAAVEALPPAIPDAEIINEKEKT